MNKIKAKENRMILIYLSLCLLSIPASFAVINSLKPSKKQEIVDAKTMTDEQLKSILASSGYNQSELKDMSREEMEAAALQMPDYRYYVTLPRLYSDALAASEFPKDKSVDTKETLIALFEEKNYDGVVQHMKNILGSYNLTTEYNSDIVKIMNDASVMNNYDSMDWQHKEEALLSLRSPEVLVVATLYAYPRRREAVVIDQQSLSPVSVGFVAITSSQVIDKGSEEFMLLEHSTDDIRSIYKITFDFGEYSNLYAYVAQSNDNTVKIIGIYSSTAREDIRTVMWWMELGQDREKGV